jgi:hypothetical protein
LPEIIRVLKINGILSIYYSATLPKKEFKKYFKLLTEESSGSLTLWEKK